MKIAVAIAIWVVIAAMLVLSAWPWHPHTNFGWLAVVVFGPPVYLLAEGVGTWLFSPEHGKQISSSRFSVGRIVVALLAVLILLGAAWFVEGIVSRYL